MHKITRRMKSRLVLSAAIGFGGLFLAAAGSVSSVKAAEAKQSLNTLAAASGAGLTAELPKPVIREVVFDVQNDLAKGGGNSGGGNANCTPSPAIVPGTDFSPKINDAVRTAAIIDLLGKIAACKPLPYSHDGIVNNNSEGHLPQAAVGYYKEYTLIVPGRKTGDGPVPVDIGGKTYMTGSMLSTRGPERIMIGGGQHIFYTLDHYATFVELTIVK